MTRPTLRTAPTHPFARILGVAGVRGDRVVPNDDIAGPINSSDEWITQRTGIKTRARANTETITKLQKLVGGRDELQDVLGDLLTFTPGKQTLVKDTDPRPAITAESVAQSDFAQPLED